MYLSNLKSVALPVPELIGDSQKIRALAMPTLSIPPPKKKKSYMPTMQTIYVFALVFPQFSIGVSAGGCQPPM